MRIIAKSTISTYCARNRRADAQAASEALWAWHAEVKKAKWKHSADVRATFGKASIISSDRVVFDICGNKYRLVAKVRYRHPGIVWIRFIGTHKEYDAINAKEV